MCCPERLIFYYTYIVDAKYLQQSLDDMKSLQGHQGNVFTLSQRFVHYGVVINLKMIQNIILWKYNLKIYSHFEKIH